MNETERELREYRDDCPDMTEEEWEDARAQAEADALAALDEAVEELDARNYSQFTDIVDGGEIPY